MGMFCTLQPKGRRFKSTSSHCVATFVIVILIVISKLLKRTSKAKRRAPAYSRALCQNQTGCPKNSPWEAQVRFPEGERRQIMRYCGCSLGGEWRERGSGESE